MSWYKVSNKNNKKTFNFDCMFGKIWDILLKSEKNKQNVVFDLENNDNMGAIKTIDLGEIKTDRSHMNIRLHAQLMSAGGDWENPIYYFRCQADTKNIVDESKYISDYNVAQYTFIYIPSLKEGNKNLIKQKGEWCLTQDEGEDINEKQLWDSLKNNALDRLKKYIADSEKEGNAEKAQLEHNVLNKAYLSDIILKSAQTNSIHKIASEFDERNILNHKILYLKELNIQLKKMSKFVFQSGSLTKKSSKEIIDNKKITSYPEIRKILLDAYAVVLDNPWKFRDICNEAMIRVDNLIYSLEEERENIFKKSNQQNFKNKGWVDNV